MKYCPKCGAQIADEAVVCPTCGCSVQGAQQVVYTAPTQQAVKAESHSVLSTIAKIFMILSCVGMGWMLIPLAWCIPMTVHYFHQVKMGQPVSVTFKVCSLLFVSVVAGILMLVDDQN